MEYSELSKIERGTTDLKLATVVEIQLFLRLNQRAGKRSMLVDFPTIGLIMGFAILFAEWLVYYHLSKSHQELSNLCFQ
jgi:hypothetical protein